MGKYKKVKERLKILVDFPANIYLSKANNRNNKKRC